MKNYFVMMALLISGFGLEAQTNAKKILVVYYSHSGNTRVVAEQIRKATGGDIVEIQTVQSYPKEYQALVDQAKKEIEEGYKPALKTKVENIGQYDVIFVGSPCWWSTFAPAVTSFLTANDLSGKTIVPFMTHEGSRLGRSEADMKKLCPNSTFLEGLPVRGGQVKQAGADISRWLKKLGLVCD